MQTDNGYEISIIHSKTNQFGPPQQVFVVDHAGDHTSAASWIALYKQKCSDPQPDDFVFKKSAKSSYLITTSIYNGWIKQYAPIIGLVKGNFSSHGLRAGGATDLRPNVAVQFDIMRQGRRKSVEMANLYCRMNDQSWQERLVDIHQATRGERY